MLGQIITVTVDRPLGSVHPKHKNIIYPINYGYVENLLGGDGEEQDAYIVGVNHPVESFTGVVIAIIKRYDDIETKLVVAPKESSFSKEQINALVYFQEQYFNYEIIM